MPSPSNVRRVLIAIAIGVMFGAPLGSMGNSFAIAVSVVVGCVALYYRNYFVIIACCCGLVFGCFRSYIQLHAHNDYADYYSQHSELLADIVSQPEQKSRTESFVARAVGTSQKIVVQIAPSSDPQFGKRVILSGTLHAPAPFNDGSGIIFNYPGYLLSKRVTAIESMPHAFLLGDSPHTFGYWVFAAAFRLQSTFAHHILARYSLTQQPIVKAVLFGDRSAMSQTDQEQFIRTGTIHLIAVSGFKLTILLLALQILLQRFIPRRALAMGTVVTSVLYSAAFAFDPPVVRAAIMSTLFMLGEIAGGGYDSAVILILLSGGMVLANPAIELFDSSFLFSVLGVLGIIILGPRLRIFFEKIFTKIRFTVPGAKLIIHFLPPATGAYLLTLPLSLYWYGEVSLVMPITVLCIMPLFEPCIILGYASAFPIVGVLAAILNQPLLHYVTWGVSHMARIPVASLHLHIPGIVAYAIYGITGIFCAVYLLKKQFNFATIHALPTKEPYEKINNL